MAFVVCFERANDTRTYRKVLGNVNTVEEITELIMSDHADRFKAKPNIELWFGLDMTQSKSYPPQEIGRWFLCKNGNLEHLQKYVVYDSLNVPPPYKES